ncbi:MAG: GNAT family N-acetyltransferase, partial [Ekhidna sp.]
EYLLWLRKSTMQNHLADSGISLSQEEHLLRVNYLFEQAKIIIFNGQNIGLLKLDEKENSLEIVQIQIDPNYQRKGIGKKIIKSVIEDFKGSKEIFLSVLKENPAQQLYQRMGFKVTGHNDDSFIMVFDNQTCT